MSDYIHCVVCDKKIKDDEDGSLLEDNNMVHDECVDRVERNLGYYA